MEGQLELLKSELLKHELLGGFIEQNPVLNLFMARIKYIELNKHRLKKCLYLCS